MLPKELLRTFLRLGTTSLTEIHLPEHFSGNFRSGNGYRRGEDVVVIPKDGKQKFVIIDPEFGKRRWVSVIDSSKRHQAGVFDDDTGRLIQFVKPSSRTERGDEGREIHVLEKARVVYRRE
jgi:hypothetical protein